MMSGGKMRLVGFSAGVWRSSDQRLTMQLII